MPPKKSNKQAKVPSVRRSARLQSREPSVESEPVTKKKVAKKPQYKTSKTPMRATDWRWGEFTPLLTREEREELLSNSAQLESEEPSPVVESDRSTGINTASKMRRELTLAKIQEGYERTLSEKQAESAVAPSPSHLPSPSPPRGPPATSPAQRDAAVVASPSTAPPPAIYVERERPQSGWRRVFSSLGGYIPSPFGRKRQAEEEVDAPSAKRSRTSGHDIESPTPIQESHVGDVPDHTPQTAKTRESPRDYAGPSTQNHKIPTSLSTITEYTEPSTISDLPETTPSKPPRTQPQRSLLSVTQSASKQMRPHTPTMRRAAQLRAARASGHTTPSTGFTARTTTAPKPREPNADARAMKLERMRILHQELEELQKDEDIKEMQTHRRKRVKVDDLVAIPHNLPGDPSGMFRVPEIDSDDEMEVYDDAEERTNIFEEVRSVDKDTHMTGQTQAKPAAAAARVEQPTPKTRDARMEEPTQMQFNFPTVGPVPAGYYVSEEFKAEAGRLFEQGLAEYLAA